MPTYQTQKQQKQKTKEKSGIYKGTIKKKDLKEIKGVAYLEKRNGQGRKNSSPEQGRSRQSRIGIIAGTSKRDKHSEQKERKIRVKEKEKFLKPKIQGNWKVARNPRVMPSMPSISMCHVATLHTAPPSCIKFETKPQATQKTQEKTFHLLWPSWHVTDDHRTWGATDGSDKNALPWRSQPSDEVIPGDEQPSLTREGKSSNDASK